MGRNNLPLVLLPHHRSLRRLCLPSYHLHILANQARRQRHPPSPSFQESKRCVRTGFRVFLWIRLLHAHLLSRHLLPIREGIICHARRHTTPSPPHLHRPLIHHHWRSHYCHRILRPRDALLHGPLLRRRRSSHHILSHHTP